MLKMKMAISYLMVARSTFRRRREVLKHVLFVDNRFRDCTPQFDYLLSGGLLPLSETTVLCRFRLRNFLSFIRHGARHGYHLRFFLWQKGIPRFQAGGAVVYPFNGQINYRTMLQRQATHIFVGHGDSNKRASVNPILRSYDVVLVVGELSKSRLLNAEVFNGGEYVIGVGPRLLSGTHADGFVFSEEQEPRFILYCPTWEGGLDSENYCSIGTPVARDALELLANFYNLPILIDCHPNLSGRIRGYRKRLQLFINSLREAGLTVLLYRPLRKARATRWLDKISSDGNIRTEAVEQVHIRFGVSDVSAMETLLASKRIPSVVLAPTAPLDELDPTYLDLRRTHLVTNEADLAGFRDILGTDQERKMQKRFQKRSTKINVDSDDFDATISIDDIIVRYKSWKRRRLRERRGESTDDAPVAAATS